MAKTQTVHIKGDKIIYESAVPVKGVDQKELYNRLTKALSVHVNKTGLQLQSDSNIATKGEIILSSPYHLIRKLEYRISTTVKNERYDYRIDSVFLFQKERGGKSKVIPSEELLKGMEVSGPVAATTERLLNEIDMRIVQLLDQLKNDAAKSIATSQ
jgi:hypothetical protein